MNTSSQNNVDNTNHLSLIFLVTMKSSEHQILLFIALLIIVNCTSLYNILFLSVSVSVSLSPSRSRNPMCYLIRSIIISCFGEALMQIECGK